MRGRGQFLRLRASSSSQRQQVDLRFTEPRFLGRELAAGFDLYSLRTDFLDQSSFENQSTGMGLRTGFPIAERTSLGLTYTLIQDDTEIADGFVDHDGNSLTPDRRAVRSGQPVRGRCSATRKAPSSPRCSASRVNWDRRNDPINADARLRSVSSARTSPASAAK